MGLDQILALIKAGKNPSKISEELSIPKQTLNYYVGKLKKLGCITKAGYGTWEYVKEVPTRPKDTIQGQNSDFSKKREIRGHAYIWKISFFNPFEWGKIINNYKRKKLTFQKICRGAVHRTILDNRKIWLTKDGMIIYESLDFFGPSSLQVKGTAVYEMDRLIKRILKELNQSFRTYRFTTSREHYAIIKNQLARQYNDRKEKMFIKSEHGTVWMWIDHSHGEQELENNEADVNRQVQNYWNDHKKHKFEVNASFVTDGFNKTNEAIQRNAEHLEYHAENMRSHVGATQDLSAASKELRSEIKKMSDILGQISNKLG